jgi:hypothetical protein
MQQMKNRFSKFIDENTDENKNQIPKQSNLINKDAHMKILLEAEIEAKNTINKAYAFRNELRKRAKVEAQKEIEAFKSKKENEYQAFILGISVEEYVNKQNHLKQCNDYEDLLKNKLDQINREIEEDELERKLEEINTVHEEKYAQFD